MREIASPISAFVRDECVVETGATVKTSELFQKFDVWCYQNGIRDRGTRSIFGRNLMAAVGGIGKSHPRSPDGKQVWIYTGIRLRGPKDDEEEATEEAERAKKSPAPGACTRPCTSARTRPCTASRSRPRFRPAAHWYRVWYRQKC